MKKSGATYFGVIYSLVLSLVCSSSLSLAGHYSLSSHLLASARVCFSRCLSRYVSGYASSRSGLRGHQGQQQAQPLSPARRILQEYKKQGIKRPFLEENKKVIGAACDKFEQIPGFDGAIQSLCTHAHDPMGAKGYLYELEAALYLTKTQQELLSRGLIEEADLEQIVSFGCHKQDTSGSRSFDIETTRRWIECKHIQWGAHQNGKKKKQFSEQKRITQSYNNQSRAVQAQAAIVYTVFSKTALSGYWRRWFDARDINYVEHAALS
jgi:hypothetical protein